MEDQSNFLQEENERGGQAGETKFEIPLEDLFPEPEVREFEIDLEWSESMEQWAFYLLAFSKFFPDSGADWKRIKDLLQQKKGKDLVIAGKKIQIKARRKLYNDIALEYQHDKHEGGSWDGWIRQPHNIDCLMYCCPGFGIAYLYDWVILQALYFYYEDDWIGGRFPLFSSPNPTYKTLNVGVPTKYLEEALIDKVDFKDATRS